MGVDEDGVLEDDSLLIVKNTTKVVDKREMDGFVKIFKHHGPTGISLPPTVRVMIRLCSSRGASHGDFSCKPEQDKWCADASHPRRLIDISRPDEGQRGHSYASWHGAQGQAPSQGTTDTGQSSLNFDLSGERWGRKKSSG